MFTDSPGLLSLHEKFIKICKENNIQALSFSETMKSRIGVKKLKWSSFLVTEESAKLGIGNFYKIQANHFNIVKPCNKSFDSYKHTLNFIKNILETIKNT